MVFSTVPRKEIGRHLVGQDQPDAVPDVVVALVQGKLGSGFLAFLAFLAVAAAVVLAAALSSVFAAVAIVLSGSGIA